MQISDIIFQESHTAWLWIDWSVPKEILSGVVLIGKKMLGGTRNEERRNKK